MAKMPKQLVAVGNRVGEIDTEIAPLIEEIWKAGITTSSSRWDDPPGKVRVAFPSATDAEVFLNIVGGYENGPGTLHDRIRKSGSSGWKFRGVPVDTSITDEGDGIELRYGPTEFVIGISVEFPQQDLPPVLTQLRRFNSQREVDCVLAMEEARFD